MTDLLLSPVFSGVFPHCCLRTRILVCPLVSSDVGDIEMGLLRKPQMYRSSRCPTLCPTPKWTLLRLLKNLRNQLPDHIFHLLQRRHALQLCVYLCLSTLHEAYWIIHDVCPKTPRRLLWSQLPKSCIFPFFGIYFWLKDKLMKCRCCQLKFRDLQMTDEQVKKWDCCVNNQFYVRHLLERNPSTLSENTSDDIFDEWCPEPQLKFNWSLSYFSASGGGLSCCLTSFRELCWKCTCKCLEPSRNLQFWPHALIL